MSKNFSLVSILIPTYQGEEFLEDTLNSALNQTYPNVEIVISDDGSKDKTLEIAKSYSDKYQGKVIVYSNKKLGMVENWNFCISVAQGEYIKFLFQDDLLASHCIEEMVELAEKDEEIGLVFSPRSLFLSSGAESVKSCIDTYEYCLDLHEAWSNLQSIQSGKTLLEDRNFLRDPFNKIGEPTTVLIRKKVFEEIGVFDTQLIQIVDLDMWTRIMIHYKIGFVNSVLSSFRIHPEQQSQKNNTSGTTVKDHQRFYEKILTDQSYRNLPKKIKLAIYAKLGNELQQATNRIKQLEQELKSKQTNTFSSELPAINAINFIRAEVEIEEAAKSYTNVIESLGVSLNLLDFANDKPHKIKDKINPVNLISINIDSAPSWSERLDGELRENKYNIGLWWSEVSELSREWCDQFVNFAEIWVSSNFILENISKDSSIPIVKISPTLNIELNGVYKKNDFCLDKDEFVFLFIFDFLSIFNKKNPLAIIQAFEKIFSSDEPVRLVLKCKNTEKDRENFTRLKNAVNNSKITIIDDELSENDENGLLSVSDCYISLHRIEGFGLNLAKAMFLEKPVIATGWSGNMDFMNISNSYLVKYDLTSISKNQEPYEPYQEGQLWAEPNIIHASQLMRYVYENPQQAKVIAKRAAKDIRQKNSVKTVGKLIKSRLEAIYTKILSEESQTHSEQLQIEQTQVQLKDAQAQLQQKQAQLQQAQIQLQETKNWISAMESSKFWQLRSKWFNIKYALKLDQPENNQKPEALQKKQEIEIPITSNQPSHDVQIFIDLVSLIPNIGFYIDGWIFDPKNQIEEINLVTQDESLSLKPFLQKKPRKDVSDYFKKSGFTQELDNLGFFGICRFENTFQLEQLKEINLLLKLKSGDSIDHKLDIQKTDNNALNIIKNILTNCPLPPYKMGVLDEIGPTIRRIWTNREKAEIKKVVKEYGTQISNPLVSIIVPLYGRIDFMKYQLALFADDPDFQENELIYVLDDPRLYAEFLEYSDTQASVFQVPFKTVYTGINLGYAGANNVGVSISKGGLLVLLNSDVMPIGPGWLSSLVNSYQSLENVGVIGPKLLYGDRSIQHAGMKFSKYAPWGDLWINDHPRKGQPNFPEINREPQKLAAVTGACMMVSRQLYDLVSGLDEDYIIGDFEDSDFCLKILSQSLANYYIPNVELFHLERQSISLYQQREQLWRTNRTIYNCWLYNQKWGKYIADNNL